MGKRWFASLNRGIGWKPATWQGWLIFIIYLSFIIYDFIRIDGRALSVSDTLINFIPEALMATVILALICYFTGEKPRT